MSAQLSLRSGCNPQQAPARASVAAGRFPIDVLNGEPGFINLLDALTSWQLVRDLGAATGAVAATSFKHVNPAGAAITRDLSTEDRRAAHLDADEVLSATANAYVRARGGDRLSSYGDWVATDHTVDESLALVLAREVSDGIIAPAYTREALELLRRKKQGSYCILEVDDTWTPDPHERRTVFGITIEQATNTVVPGPQHLSEFMTTSRHLPEPVHSDVLAGMTAVKHAVSNAVAICHEGQVIGLAAGQQSRIDATRLACRKAERWWLRRHPTVLDLPLRPDLTRKQRDNAVDAYLDGHANTVASVFTRTPEPLDPTERDEWLTTRPPTSLVSDGAIPFRDNVDRAAAAGVGWIAQTGGSTRDDEVAAAADEHGITMIATGVRLFTH